MKNVLFRRKNLGELLKKKGDIQLKQTLGAFDLVLLGVGAIVGTGIFILPGTVAASHSDQLLFFHLL